MTNELQRARAGEPVNLSASTWNSFVDNVGATRRLINRGATTQAPSPRGDLPLVKNTTGANLDRFAIVELTQPIFHSASQQFQNRIVFDCQLPTGIIGGGTRPAFGRSAVIQEQAAPDALVPVMITGQSLARIVLGSPWHTYADMVAGDTVLASGVTGFYKVIWVDDPDVSSEQWALVEFGASYMESSNLLQNTTGGDLAPCSVVEVEEASGGGAVYRDAKTVTADDITNICISPDYTVPDFGLFEPQPINDALAQVNGAPALNAILGAKAGEVELFESQTGFINHGADGGRARVRPFRPPDSFEPYGRVFFDPIDLQDQPASGTFTTPWSPLRYGIPVTIRRVMSCKIIGSNAPLPNGNGTFYLESGSGTTPTVILRVYADTDTGPGILISELAIDFSAPYVFCGNYAMSEGLVQPSEIGVIATRAYMKLTWSGFSAGSNRIEFNSAEASTDLWIFPSRLV